MKTELIPCPACGFLPPCRCERDGKSHNGGVREIPQTRKTAKPKVRRMRLHVSCKRKGQADHMYQVEWDEPEDRALDRYKHYEECLRLMLKADGHNV